MQERPRAASPSPMMEGVQESPARDPSGPSCLDSPRLGFIASRYRRKNDREYAGTRMPLHIYPIRAIPYTVTSGGRNGSPQAGVFQLPRDRFLHARPLAETRAPLSKRSHRTSPRAGPAEPPSILLDSKVVGD